MNKMQNFIFDEFITTAHTHLFEIIILLIFVGWNWNFGVFGDGRYT